MGDASDLYSKARQIVRLIETSRIDTSTEKQAQAQIESLLVQAGIPFQREKALSPADIPDFMLPDTGLAIEVKIKGAQKRAVFHQLSRYAEHETVAGVLLITSLSMGLPAVIEGKPAFYASLGKGWL